MNDFPWLIVNLEWYKYYQPQLEVNWNIFISKKMILHFIASIINKWFLFQGNVEMQLKNQCDKQLVIGLKVLHSPHFIVSFLIYAFVNFHLIKSITKQKWFITSSLLLQFLISIVLLWNWLRKLDFYTFRITRAQLIKLMPQLCLDFSFKFTIFSTFFLKWFLMIGTKNVVWFRRFFLLQHFLENLRTSNHNMYCISSRSNILSITISNRVVGG